MRPALRLTFPAALVAIALVAACGTSPENKMKDERQQAAARMDQARALKTLGAPAAPNAQPADAASVGGMNAPAERDEESSQTSQIPGGSYGTDTIAPTMIIRTGMSSIEVDSLEPAVARVRELAHRVGGFVANVQMAAGHEQVRSATLQIRLPSSRFDEVVTGLKPIGRVESVNVNAEDVGEEFVDVTARVENAHKLEARLIEVLNTRTGKLKDVLDVEREIARVREEIERMEGRLRYLRARTSVSTFSITVHETYPVVGERGSTSVIGDAFKQSWRNFVNFIARFIAALGTLIPTVALIGLAVYVAIRMLKRMGAKPAAKAE
jgi:hypothetical protein